MLHYGTSTALVAICLLASTAGHAHAQTASEQRGNNIPPPPKPEWTPLPARFQFEPEASEALHRLWTLSSDARQEMVACIGGVPHGDSVLVTRVLILEPGRADSLGVSAQASIDRCGPPEFQGTVHTHIALREGERPYASFSGADKGVMMLWWRRWQAEGYFCVLYSPDQAYCEASDGGRRGRRSRGAY